ncbi:hypothetical protein [Armatimonas sp.]|uniref:hypothetical protein n=1 Tax=Armatimonas sp. TaxID=1872638 RepID=UPI003751EB19
MKGIPALSGASDREAIIASKTEEYGTFGDVILREELFGHTYLWNVGHAAHIVTTSTRPQSPLVLAEYDITEELCRQWRPDMVEERAMRLDLTVPHIVAALEDRTVILCCWMRLFKAVRMGVTELPAYWLNAEDAEGCLVYHLAPEIQEGEDS